MSKMSELARQTEKEEIAYINSLCEEEPYYVSSCCTADPLGNIHELDSEYNIHELDSEYYGLCGKCKEHTDFIDNNEED